jgi:hypothetical protein
MRALKSPHWTNVLNGSYLGLRRIAAPTVGGTIGLHSFQGILLSLRRPHCVTQVPGMNCQRSLRKGNFSFSAYENEPTAWIHAECSDRENVHPSTRVQLQPGRPILPSEKVEALQPRGIRGP